MAESDRVGERVETISKLFKKVDIIGKKQKQNENSLLNYLEQHEESSDSSSV